MDRRHFLTTAAGALAAWNVAPCLAAERNILTLSDGDFAIPINVLGSNMDASRIKSVLDAEGAPSANLRNPINVTIVRRGDDVILFDCGAGQNFAEGTGKLPGNLAAAGIDPERVKHVVFTHAHPDHLWGALDDFGSPAFPNASFHIAASERDFWLSPNVFEKLPEDRQAFAAGAQRLLRELAPVLQTFRPGEEVVAGVAAFETAGHTPGHVSFEVRDGSEVVMVLGDALTHAVVSFQYPEWRAGFDQEPDRAIATRKRLLDRLAAERLRVVGYHLPNGGIGRVERSGTAFRFVPEV
jgi:glyoxylase-like metal-dependent hydrolase (beta-lactamase superfamily II)